MQKNSRLLLLYILFGISINLFAQAASDQSKARTTQFATIDVLVIFYANTAGAQISPYCRAQLAV